MDFRFGFIPLGILVGIWVPFVSSLRQELRLFSGANYTGTETIITSKYPSVPTNLFANVQSYCIAGT